MSMRSLTLPGLAALLLAVLPVGGAVAQEPLPEPAGDVILTVAGDLAVAGPDGVARFDLPMLQSLGEVSIETSTIWTEEGVHRFDGVPLRAILDRLGVGAEGMLSAIALNDYAMEIPISEIGPESPIVAWAMNGALMSVRTKGPLWVLYPFDSDPAYRSEVIYSRSIWQLDRLTVAAN